MLSRPLIIFMSMLSLAWIIWMLVALHIANEMQQEGSPIVTAAYDTKALAYEPSSVCLLRTVPRPISRV